MIDRQTTDAPVQNERVNDIPMGSGQLVQLRVPLDQAADAFARPDAQGRTPIVLVPLTPSRIQMNLLAIGALAIAIGIPVTYLIDRLYLAPWIVIAGLLLIFAAVFRAFTILVPEGTTALLAQRGRHVGTRDSGVHYVSPWIAVSHLVTRREIPYDAPVFETPTRDNVRASIDTLLTFSITDPYRFVYSISADDFDQVLQATCQDALRSMVRQVTLDRVLDIDKAETEALVSALNAMIQSYGVTIARVVVTAARPPLDYLRSEEARILSIVQRAEQAERQALAQRRQADAELLAHQQVMARIEREGEELRLQLQQAEARLRVVGLETEAEMLRLSRLEDALKKFPLSAAREMERSRLDVVRALAGNTRAVVQIGSAEELARAVVVRDLYQGERAAAPDVTTSGDARDGDVAPPPQTSAPSLDSAPGTADEADDARKVP